MRSLRNSILLYFIILYISGKIVRGNVLYRVGFDFGFGLTKTSFNGTFKISEGKSNDSTEQVSAAGTFTTTAPVLATIWSQQEQLNTEAKDKLESTRDAVTEMQSEFLHLVGRSPYIASRVKQMNIYLYKVHAVLDESGTADNRFTTLQEFVQLVDDLRVPPITEQGGKSSLEYTVMKMALEKYKLIELQTEILVETLQAVEAWQKYSETQLLETIAV